MARLCWEELKEKGRIGKVKSRWERRKEGSLKKGGGARGGREKKGGRGLVWGVRENREMQKNERWEIIGKSEYSRLYKEVKGEGIPGCLKKGWGRAGVGE